MASRRTDRLETHAQLARIIFEFSQNLSAMLAEPGRMKAYSSDLRWRVIWQRIKKARNIPECCKLGGHHQLYITGLVLDNLSMYLGEICSEIKYKTGVEVTPSSCCGN